MSHRPRPRRRRASTVAVAAVLLAVGLTGCAGGPSAGAQAGQAGELLRSLVLPSGSEPFRPGGAAPTAFQSDEIGCAGMAEREQYWRVPGLSIDATQAWFEGHAPHGLRIVGTGSGGGPSGETMTDVDYGVRPGDALPAESRVAVEAVAEGTGSVVRASAQVPPASGCDTARFSGALH